MYLSLIVESVGCLIQTSKTGKKKKLLLDGPRNPKANDEGLSSLGLPGAFEILKCSTRPAT